MPSSFVLGFLEGPELIVLLLVILVLFGSTKLPQLARSLGSAQREFKKGLNEDADEPEKKDSPGNSKA